MSKTKTCLTRKVTSIVSAHPGWVAVFTDNNGKHAFSSPVAVWAIIKDKDGFTFVSGLTEEEGGIGVSEEMDGFDRYEFNK